MLLSFEEDESAEKSHQSVASLNTTVDEALQVLHSGTRRNISERLEVLAFMAEIFKP
jgi:sorbitol-specific phosphotransferase system component IIBC